MIARLKKDWPFHVLLIPSVVLTLIFSYGPMYGLIMAFQNYNPGLGFSRSPWVGLDNYRFLFASPQFVRTIWNTLFISFMKIFLSVLMSVTFALLLNEVRNMAFKRVSQTIIYIPNFISWVILAGILFNVLASDGIVNMFLGFFRIGPVNFLANPSVFPWTLIWTDVLRMFGFGTVVYLAAITSIDPELYESAVVDGAGRWRQTISITLPLLGPIIVLMTVLALGRVLDAGFEQVWNLYSPIVFSTGDIIDTFVFRLGLQNGQFSHGTAVGLFKSVIATVLMLFALWIADKVANYRVF